MDGACEALSLFLRILCRVRGAAEHRGLGGLRVPFVVNNNNNSRANFAEF